MEKPPQVEKDSLAGQRCMYANWERENGQHRHIVGGNPSVEKQKEEKERLWKYGIACGQEKNQDRRLENKKYREYQFLL